VKDELSLADAPWLLDVDLDYFGVDSPASELAERGAAICYKFYWELYRGLHLKSHYSVYWDLRAS
jgi:hypothetical protein